MKAFYLLFALLDVSGGLSAQINTFPATGNVGIDRTSPQNRLQVTVVGISVAGASSQ